jgi:hypothetical protein
MKDISWLQPDGTEMTDEAWGEGNQALGVYIAGAAAVAFLGLAVGWWVLYIGFILGVIGLVGWVFEFSRGQHAH